MNKTPLWAAALCLVLACGARAQTVRLVDNPAGSGLSADHIVVLVNSDPITNGEVRARLARTEVPANTPREAALRQVLERLIDEKTQLQWAAETGLKVDEPTLNEAEANVARQNGLTLSQLHERLVQAGLSRNTLRANLRDEILLQRVREREIENRLRISEQDIDTYLREHQDPGGQNSPQMLHLAQVLVAVPEDASPETEARLRQRAEDVVRRARAGEDFVELARTLSDSADKQSGGSLGRRPAERYPTLFVEATQDLKVGAVSEPLRSGAGFHVLKVLEKRNPKLPDTHVTQTHARHILLRVNSPKEEAAALGRMAQWREQVQRGEARFEALAQEHSQDGSAKQGGDLGWASPGQFVPEFEQAMNALAPGQVAEPLVSRFGVHLIQVLERRDVPLSAREQREWVRRALREERSEATYQEWAAELRGRAYVEYRETLR